MSEIGHYMEAVSRLRQENAHLNDLYSAQTERRAELEARLGRAEEALHQWMGAFAAGYFDNLARERRLTVLEIAKASEAVLAEQEKKQRVCVCGRAPDVIHIDGCPEQGKKP